MRIPIDSCEGCIKEIDITPAGYHIINGTYKKCAFVTAEMASLPEMKLLGVYMSYKKASRKAKKIEGAYLQWCGQVMYSDKWPQGLWLVVIEKNKRITGCIW